MLRSDSSNQEAAAKPSMSVARPRAQRRPVMVVVSLLLVLAGAAGGALAFLSVGETVEAVAARVPIHRGQLMAADNFVTVQVNPSQELRFTGPAGLEALVGQRAAHDIAAGTLVDVTAATQSVTPTTGRAVVGFSLPPGTQPGVELMVGDRVRVVLVEPVYHCASTTGEEPCATAGSEIAGEVVSVTPDAASGQLSVAVMVAEQDAGLASAAAALGRAAVVLDSRER